jgi:hypothetical protein
MSGKRAEHCRIRGATSFKRGFVAATRLNARAFAVAIVLSASNFAFGATTATLFCRGALGYDGSGQIVCGPKSCLDRLPEISPDPQAVQGTDLALSFISDFCEHNARFIVLTKNSLTRCQRKGACGNLQVLGPLDAPLSRYAGKWECQGTRLIACYHASKVAMSSDAPVPVYQPPEAHTLTSPPSHKAIDGLVLLFLQQGKVPELPPLGSPDSVVVRPDCTDYYNWCFGQVEPDSDACRSYIAECR